MAHFLGSNRSIRRQPGGNYRCYCPAHADHLHNPSLDVKWSNNTLLYKCWSNECSFTDIAAAIRSQGRDPVTGEHISESRRGSRPDYVPSKPRPAPPIDELEANYRYDPFLHPDWLNHPRVKKFHSAGYKATNYVYRNLDGAPMMLALRLDKIDPAIEGKRKRMLAITPWVKKTNGELRIAAKAMPAPRMLYGTETLRRPGPVWIVEGEKCRDALDTLLLNSMPVVTPYGSNPEKADLSLINSRPKIILRDNDEKGLIVLEHYQVAFDGKAVPLPCYWSGTGPIPKNWDIADEINAKQVPDHPPIQPLTIETFLAFLKKKSLLFIRPDYIKTVNIATRHIEKAIAARHEREIADQKEPEQTE